MVRTSRGRGRWLSACVSAASLMCVAGGLSPADMMGRSAAQGRDPTNIGSKPGQFTIEDVVWGGELAAPWEYPEARFEQKVRALPFERDNAFSAKHDPLGLDREEATGSTTGATDSNSNSEWITDDDSEDDLYTLEELAARRQRYMRNRRRYLAAAAAAGEADPDGVGWEWKGKTRSSSPSPTAPPSVRPSPTASPTVSPVPSATVSPTPRHGAFINCHETTTPDCKDPLPRSFSWYNFHGRGMLTKVLNQHIPQYCAACWAHAAGSMISDRVKIARAAGDHHEGPDINVAVQVILNCAKRLAGTCANGTLHGVFTYVNDANGIPFDTCQNYMADDGKVCEKSSYCKSCRYDGYCYGVENAPGYDSRGLGIWTNGVPKVVTNEWGYIGRLLGNTARDIQIEIITRGPVACMVNPMPLFDYKAGVIHEPWNGVYQHSMEVLGWGVTNNGAKFWHARNSWGEYWGENGFARIARGNNSIGVEGMCAWVVPEFWGMTSASGHGHDNVAAQNSMLGQNGLDAGRTPLPTAKPTTSAAPTAGPPTPRPSYSAAPTISASPTPEPSVTPTRSVKPTGAFPTSFGPTVTAAPYNAPTPLQIGDDITDWHHDFDKGTASEQDDDAASAQARSRRTLLSPASSGSVEVNIDAAKGFDWGNLSAGYAAQLAAAAATTNGGSDDGGEYWGRLGTVGGVEQWDEDAVESFWWRGFSAYDNGPYDYSDVPENYIAPGSDDGGALNPLTPDDGLAATEAVAGDTANWRPLDGGAYVQEAAAAAVTAAAEEEASSAAASLAAATKQRPGVAGFGVAPSSTMQAGSSVPVYAMLAVVSVGCIALGYAAGSRSERRRSGFMPI